ncbi:MAG: ABC transporter permease [Armatimonadetes bacterium]|nr:ABC transporter permease [Armatimonadota bacterium]
MLELKTKTKELCKPPVVGFRPRAVQFINENFIWVLLVLIMAGATVMNPRFLTSNNIFNILVASASLGCLVLAESIVFFTGNFDLSIEANMIFVAIVGGLIMAYPTSITNAAGATVTTGGLGLSWPLALVVMLALSSTIGLANGLMVVRLRMNNFMVTLATSIVLAGLALVVGEARNLFGIPDGFRFVGAGKLGPVPIAAIFLLILFAVAHFVLSRTVFGRQLYAVGSNREAARAAGINDDRVIIHAYLICGFLSGLAAYVLVGRLGAASAGISNGALFLAVAAAVIGGVSLMGGRGTAPGMLGGLLLVSTIGNAMNLAQIPANYVRVVSGAVILLAVFIDALRSRR